MGTPTMLLRGKGKIRRWFLRNFRLLVVTGWKRLVLRVVLMVLLKVTKFLRKRKIRIARSLSTNIRTLVNRIIVLRITKAFGVVFLIVSIVRLVRMIVLALV